MPHLLFHKRNVHWVPDSGDTLLLIVLGWNRIESFSEAFRSVRSRHINWKAQRQTVKPPPEHLDLVIVIDWYKYRQINVNYWAREDLDFLRTIDSGDRCVPVKALIHQTTLDSEEPASSNFFLSYWPLPLLQAIDLKAVTQDLTLWLLKIWNLKATILILKRFQHSKTATPVERFNVCLFSHKLNIKQIRARTEAW